MIAKINQPMRRALGSLLLLAAMTVSTACGGGGTKVNSFTAKRIVAYGDESSLIVDVASDGNGAKYGVNATVSPTDPTRACRTFPIWIQVLANRYGLVFAPCNPGPTPVSSPTSRIRAALGAQAADLATQISAQLAEGPIQEGDLSTVLVGENDVIAQYQQYPMLSEPQITANVEAAGAETGRQVNRLADAGSKVLVATIYDVGKTPYATAERAGHIDTDRAALLSRLSTRYNAALRSTMANDGHRIGIVLLDELVGSITAILGVSGFTNTKLAVCDPAKSKLRPPSVLDCTDQTLIADGNANTFLWADDRHLSAGGQMGLGNLAVQRADNNPF